MNRLLPCLVLLIMAGLGPVRAADLKSAEAEKLFAVKVWPVLQARCLPCHGDDPKKLRGGLDLTTGATALKGGESGAPALVAGKPHDSPMYVAITRKNNDFVMPPKESDKLSASEVELVRRWIADGAPWPSAARIQELSKAAWDEKDGVTVATSGGLAPEWTNRKYKPEDLWAYQPIRRPLVPEVRGQKSEVRNPIDAFLSEKLAQLDLAPAPLADRRTLLRRATFDLIGLAPSPEDIEAFVKDPAPDEVAFGRVVDRLLASPHYGEQWGRHWLDVVRYADSSGLANDYERGNAWRYRDYVVRSLNADKPYDRFLREQLAGDEINPKDPELLIATGFLRMGPWELTGMEVAKVARQKFLDDVTETVGQVFLGHPLQCARCHDHKFDPVPTRDYYRIQSAFATTQLTERPADFLSAENTQGFEEKKYLLARQAKLEAELKRIQAVEGAARKRWAEANPDKVSQKPPRFEFLSAADLGMERIARKGLERLKWELDRYEPVALSVYSGHTPTLKSVYAPLRIPANRTAGELETTSILPGGDPFSPQAKVTPGVLSAVPGSNDTLEKTSFNSIPEAVEGRRKALADWIASPRNPLTPRVMVNRLWQGHFGQAIAGNPNNFGATGKKPSHPELLDWLAVEFVERGWSIKALHRIIMTSEAYRRASQHPDPKTLAAKDPGGISYAVFKPRRLAAEELRDAMLAASGELNRAIGGIPVRPELNREVALQPRQVMGTFAPAWQPSPQPEQRHRRSLYAQKLRGLRDPFFEVFNQPSPESSCEGREASTVTPQVFSLLNSDATTARALAFASRLLKEAKSREDVIARAFLLAFGRLPTEVEQKACLKHWEVMTTRHQSLKFERPKLPREVVREAVEENTGEKFSFTEVLESTGDFVPDLHPADVKPELRGLMEVCLVLLNANEFVYID